MWKLAVLQQRISSTIFCLLGWAEILAETHAAHGLMASGDGVLMVLQELIAQTCLELDREHLKDL